MIIDLSNLINSVGSELLIDTALEPVTLDDSLVDNIHAKGVIKNFSGRLELHLNLVADYHDICSRCTKELIIPLDITVDDRLVKEETDDEYILIENDMLDLSAVAAEIFSLNMPIRILCDKDCKGLCPVCGCNLDENKCECVTKTIDPRLEGLRALLINNEEG